MYLEHFGLREFPFSITPDTAFAFRSRAQQRALSVLLVAFQLMAKASSRWSARSAPARRCCAAACWPPAGGAP
jgi:hypothetical protein